MRGCPPSHPVRFQFPSYAERRQQQQEPQGLYAALGTGRREPSFAGASLIKLLNYAHPLIVLCNEPPPSHRIIMENPAEPDPVPLGTTHHIPGFRVPPVGMWEMYTY
jgi:hypothetical protein